ncbi:MAG: D-alanine--D-alanine ligase [Dysgonamonadaceae bacterium]|jgi:D-alanine-D-alanine ligase|nr:D-alanine--D-alanine ligase [Dysgonamonadaceae bacterium]
MNSKKNIAIVAGGYSSEIVVSLKSAQGIKSFIDGKQYNVFIVLITKEQWIVRLADEKSLFIDKNDFSFTDGTSKTKFDFAYITIHGTPGEDGLLQGYFDMLNIPYSCCGVLAAALSFNKYFCNNYLKNFGVKTALSVYLQKEDSWNPDEIVQKLSLPVFVKPNDSGSSFGVSKVVSTGAIQTAISAAFEEGNSVLIEQFMPGTEITCGCYKVNGKTVVLPLTEVVSKNEFFDFDAKYNPNSVEEITPARISSDLTGEIQSLTAKIYDWIGAKGIIRVDYIVSSECEIRMLEVNTTPGMTVTSFIPQQVRAAGLDMKDVLTAIIEDELNKKRYYGNKKSGI